MTQNGHGRGAGTTGPGRVMPPVENTEAAWDDVEVAAGADPAPLLPEGAEVDIIVIKTKVRRVYKRWGAELDCLVLDPDGQPRHLPSDDGLAHPMILKLHFEVPASRRGVVLPTSRFYRLWTTANRGLKPFRRDRMSLSVFRGQVFRARTRIVKRDGRPQSLAECHWYSVVDDLL
jgi:hypothetical protein